MILLIDNYDSFSYNLFQFVGAINPDIKVVRNDALSIDEIDSMKPEAIIISPGPGRPENAGICIEMIKKLGSKYPILGVCLGHQAICTAYGGKVGYAKELMHGKQSDVSLDKSCKLFDGIDEVVKVARYHSLALDESTLPDSLSVVAKTVDGEVMAVKHKEYEVYGVQFHPESIMTPDGFKMLENFLKK